MGQYKDGAKEEVDRATSQREADYLLAEYRMAYAGTGFTVWIKE